MKGDDNSIFYNNYFINENINRYNTGDLFSKLVDNDLIGILEICSSK